MDALVARQTRAHRVLDLDVDAAREGAVPIALREPGYAVATDSRPNRVELAAPGSGYVDVHPLVIAPSGDARQAGLDGGWHEFPASYFTTGTLGGFEVPCVSVQAKRAFRTGYELREVDRHDLTVLDEMADDAR